MTEPITVAVLVTLAVQKFVESSASELAKKYTIEALAKISELWQQIKTKLQGKSVKVDDALVRVEAGTGIEAAKETIIKYLDVEMEEDKDFAGALKRIAAEIQNRTVQVIAVDIEAASFKAKNMKQKATAGDGLREQTMLKNVKVTCAIDLGDLTQEA